VQSPDCYRGRVAAFFNLNSIQILLKACPIGQAFCFVFSLGIYF
jgi:hypothetical protein